MKKKLIAVSLVLSSTSIFAQTAPGSNSNFYGEVGIHSVGFTPQAKSWSSSDHTVGTVVLGYKLAPNLSAELLVGGGLSDGTLTHRTAPSRQLRVDNVMALMLRPSFMVGERVEAFARGGYGRIAATEKDRNDIYTDSDETWMWGLGANYYFSKNLYGQLSYTSFYKRENASAQGFGLSVGYKF